VRPPIEIDGGLPDAGRLVAALPNPNSAVDVALGSATVYWTTGSEVMSAPLAGGDATILAFAQKGTVGLAIDTQSLYWANKGGPFGDGTIVSMPLAGSAAVTLAGSQDAPRAIAVDDVGVYWTAGGSVIEDGGTSPGSVPTAPFDGGAPTVLATGLGAPGPIAAHGGVIVYAAAGGPLGGSQIASVPRAAGASTLLAATDRRVVSVALDDANAYWADANTLGVDSTTDDGRIRSVPLASDAGADAGAGACSSRTSRGRRSWSFSAAPSTGRRGGRRATEAPRATRAYGQLRRRAGHRWRCLPISPTCRPSRSIRPTLLGSTSSTITSDCPVSL
jgi:hypothetical protein